VELETRTASPLSFCFLLRNIVWSGVVHPIKFRLHLVFLHLSGVGYSTVFFYVEFKTMNTGSAGMHVEHEGRR
jgi:hypothetical protein